MIAKYIPPQTERIVMLLGACAVLAGAAYWFHLEPGLPEGLSLLFVFWIGLTAFLLLATPRRAWPLLAIVTAALNVPISFVLANVGADCGLEWATLPFAIVPTVLMEHPLWLAATLAVTGFLGYAFGEFERIVPKPSVRVTYGALISIPAVFFLSYLAFNALLPHTGSCAL